MAFLSSATDAGRDLGYENILGNLKLSSVSTYVIGNETRKSLGLVHWSLEVTLKEYIDGAVLDK